MTTADITSKISALRAEIEKDSVSPENVGYLLQLVHDYTNSVKTLLTENLESLRKTIDNIEYDGLTSGGTIDGNLYVNGDARISDCLLVDGVANFGSSVIVNDGFWAHGGAYIYDGLEVFGPASFLNSITAEKIIANGPLVCVSDFDSNSVTTTAGLESFRIGSSTNPNDGWGTYIWSYDNGHGFIQQGSAETGETFPLILQPFGGNVGINWGNNSSPQYTLDVNGAIRSTSVIIAKSIDINEVFEADTLSATLNSIDVFEVNSATVLLNSNVDITGNATIGGTLDVTGDVTADGLTIGEVLISYDNRALGPELNANVLIVNGKTVFTDEIEVSEHVTIDRRGYITGVMYTGDVDCTGYTQQEGVFVVQSSEPMELDTNVNIYQGLNVTNNATVGGKLSVTGLIQSYETISASKGLIAYGGGLQIYNGGIDCKGGDVQIADSLRMKEKESYEYVQVLSICEDSPVIYIGNFEDLDKGNYVGIALWGETSIHGNLNASSATIDTSLVVNGPLSLGNYAAFSNDFINLGDGTVSDLNIQAVNVNIEATNFNVDSSIAVTGETLLQDLSVTGSAMFNSGFWSIGRSSFEYPIYMNCEMSESHTGIYMQELQEWEHIRVIGFSGDAAGNEYIDIGEEQHANSSKYYAGIRLQGPTQIKGKLEARNHVNLGPDLIKVDATIAKVTISGQAVRFNTSIDATGFGIAAKTLSLYGNIILNPWTDSDGVERNSALYAYSTDASREHLIGLGGDPAQMLYIEIGTECDSAERIFLNLPTTVSGMLSASGIDANYSLSVGSGDILSLDEETFYLEVSNATIDASVDFMGGANFADAIFTNKGINTGGNIHLGYHSNTALGVHTSLTTEFADTGMKVHLIGLQDTTNGKSLLSIGSKSYASATAPDAIILITSHEVGSIELIGNVYVPQTFRLGGATFTYDATYDRVVCDKQIVNAGAGK